MIAPANKPMPRFNPHWTCFWTGQTWVFVWLAYAEGEPTVVCVV
jgi:hypothetical protein